MTEQTLLIRKTTVQQKLLFRVIVLTVLAVLLAGPRSVSAYHATSETELGEVDIRTEGAKRTKRSYLVSMTLKCIKEQDAADLSTINSDELGQCIYNTRLFSRVSVRVEKPVIHVEVEERWTLLPIPRYETTDDSYAYGGFVFESNFLGYGKALAVGGMASSEGDTFFLFFRDPSVMYSHWTLGLSTMVSRQEQFMYSGTDTVYGYEESSKGFGIWPGYDLTPYTNTSLILGYGSRRYEDVDSFPPPEDFEYYDSGVRVTYDKSDYRLFFNEGLRISLELKRRLWASDESELGSDAEASISLARIVGGTFAVQFAAKGIYVTGDEPRDVHKMGGRVGSRGIERQGLWVEKAGTVSLDIQVPLKDMRFAVWTVAPFLDYGAFEPVIDIPEKDYVCYGIGTYLYLKKINIPGMGLILGRNESFMGDFVTFFIGISAR